MLKNPPFLKEMEFQPAFFIDILRLKDFEFTYPLWEISTRHWVEFNSDKVRIFHIDAVIHECSYDEPSKFIDLVRYLMIEQVLES